MSTGSNNILFTPSWRSRNRHTDHPPNNNDDNRHSIVPRPLFNAPEESRGGTQDPWWLFEQRVRTGPYRLTGFPSRPHSPIRILILDDQTSRTVSPRLRQFVRDSPPRIRGEWHMQLAAEEEEPQLTQESFREAMSKLKRQTYNPYSRRRARRRGLFSRNNNNNNNTNINGEDEGDECKECAICLETFDLNQEVLVTPCNHMFHSGCLEPWVRTHGQCPVCRFTLCERRRENALALNNRNNANEFDVVRASELIALIRAMEEAFEWVHMSRY